MAEEYQVFVSKEVIIDNWESGEVGLLKKVKEEEYLCSENSLIEAINKASDMLFNVVLNIDNFVIIDNGISYSRTENIDGEEPSVSELKEWKSGKIDLYNAYYHFAVKKVSEVSVDEFTLIGIHEY